MLKLGALKGTYDAIPYFQFSAEALAEFLTYRTGLEARIRSGELSAVLEGHIAKYRKLVPTLALINHLADSDLGRGDIGNVSHAAVLKALAFTAYLESHARRLYGASNTVDLFAATAILNHIRKDDLKEGFTARDVHQRDWSNLTDREHVQAGLELLVDLDYLARSAAPVGNYGGRPKVTYRINPRAMK
jgi:putative DNA primase/helicase